MSQSYTRQSFHSSSAPAPNGNYSHAILQQSSATLHIAGWMGDDPKTGKIVEGGIGAQTVRSSLIQ
jgi:2-iminobutanoate/2-iminopropanoate deaminase